MSSLGQLRKQDASPALVLTIVCAGVVLASLDLFIVNVALPTIARDLHVSSLGSLLVAASWRWIFFVNVPVGLAAFVIGWLRLPNVPGHPAKRPDALGAVLITAAVGLLSLALVQGNDWAGARRGRFSP